MPKKPVKKRASKKSSQAKQPKWMDSLPHEIVIVTWVDAVTDDKWQDIDEAKSGLKHEWTINTGGFLVKNSGDELIVAGNIDQNGEIGRYMVIHKSCVKSIKRGVEASGVTHVKWKDAFSWDDWQPADDALKNIDSNSIVHSAGFVIEEQKDSISMVGSTGKEDSVCMVLQIPNGMVIEVNEIP